MSKPDSLCLTEKRELYPKLGQHVAIVATSTSQFKETGFGSIDTCRELQKSLEQRYARVSFQLVESMSDLEKVKNEKPDLVVLCQKYFIPTNGDQKIWFSEYFEKNKINFTGSVSKSLIFDSNKSIAKTMVSNHGLATANFFLAAPGQYRKEHLIPLKFPLFVKPIDGANGYGIDSNSIVHDFSSFEQKLEALFALHNEKILVEEFLPGREFTVAILDDESTGQRWSFPMEITQPKNKLGDRILGFNEKNKNLESLHPVSEVLSAKLDWFADRIFTTLKARDFARIDIKLDRAGAPNFLEINLVPGMTRNSSYFPNACSFHHTYSAKNNPEYGLNHVDVVCKIVELGLKRRVVLS